MKKVAKSVVVGLILVPMLVLGACAKRCCNDPCAVDNMRRQCGGCK